MLPDDDAALVELGAARHRLRAGSVLAPLADHVDSGGQPGRRLRGDRTLQRLVEDGPIGDVARAAIGPWAFPVRAILFDKTADANWSLGWHQDRTVAVRERVDHPGFGPWTVKQGICHVEPPFAVIAGMLTLRIHLDDVPADHAPLLVAPGSHRLGRIPEASLDEVVRRCGTMTCLAEAGDIWAYATPIVHASARSRRRAHRRVLQVDYAAGALPDGLEWLGIGSKEP